MDGTIRNLMHFLSNKEKVSCSKFRHRTVICLEALQNRIETVELPQSHCNLRFSWTFVRKAVNRIQYSANLEAVF